MRHFIAYHNTEKMGRALREGNPLGLLTSKPVRPLLNNTVWFITGEGAGTRNYCLGSVFRVTGTGDTDEGGFKHFASGEGHVFQPPVPVGDASWFPELLRITGHFGLGVQEVKGEEIISGLSQIAAQVGYEVG